MEEGLWNNSAARVWIPAMGFTVIGTVAVVAGAVTFWISKRSMEYSNRRNEIRRTASLFLTLAFVLFAVFLGGMATGLYSVMDLISAMVQNNVVPSPDTDLEVPNLLVFGFTLAMMALHLAVMVYMGVRMAAHYIVGVGVALLLGMIWSFMIFTSWWPGAVGGLVLAVVVSGIYMGVQYACSTNAIWLADPTYVISPNNWGAIALLLTHLVINVFVFTMTPYFTERWFNLGLAAYLAALVGLAFVAEVVLYVIVAFGTNVLRANTESGEFPSTIQDDPVVAAYLDYATNLYIAKLKEDPEARARLFDEHSRPHEA